VGVASAGLSHWLEGSVDSFTLMSTLGLFVLLTSALASLWLHRLHKEQSS